jgi:hypothetical protein
MVAWGGARQSQAVSIPTNGNSANGDLGWVRTRAGNIEFIGCFVSTSGFSSTADGTINTSQTALMCMAADEQNVQRSCTSAAPFVIDVVRALKDDSSLFFSADATGRCLIVSIDNGSATQPKRP